MAIIKKTGHEVRFTKPVKTTFAVEHADPKIALGMAIDMAKGRYPNENWNNLDYSISSYIYSEVVWKS